MKSFVSSFALVAVTATASQPGHHGDVHDILAELSAALEHPLPEHPERLDVGSWRSALACTADLEGQQPGLIDEGACATATADGGGACVWCDSSNLIGTGVCVGPNVKDRTGPLWEAVCGAAADDMVPDVAVPTVSVEDATPATLGDGGLPDMLKCSLDESMSVVDEAACVARQDADGQDCVWCGVSFLGSGACTTSTVKNTIGFLCSAAAEEGLASKKEGGHLRGGQDQVALEDHL